ncbi:hypothetical protein [Thiohalocapsa halophila]|uniref:hypothetical protein n=1 Tax=Thiohalocapsa halophila TaxID=69359 RepID=UPI0019077E1E|nr:hypothetical protein [Thiohalocapsa halophila]
MRFPHGLANFQAKWNFSLVDSIGDAEAMRGALQTRFPGREVPKTDWFLDI